MLDSGCLILEKSFTAEIAVLGTPPLGVPGPKVLWTYGENTEDTEKIVKSTDFEGKK